MKELVGGLCFWWVSAAPRLWQRGGGGEGCCSGPAEPAEVAGASRQLSGAGWEAGWTARPVSTVASSTRMATAMSPG